MMIPDPIADDMALCLPGPDGLTVIFGCAHAGAVNTLDHILRQIGDISVHTLIGGLHLAAASPERMDLTLAVLRKLAPVRLGFCHCTGTAAIHRIWTEFPGACHEIHVGKRLQVLKVPLPQKK